MTWTELKYWHERLDTHFSSLAASRKEGRVFALEHGLSPEERQALKAVAPAALGIALDTYWIPVAVHATEVAYLYRGDEYWDTFGAETPGWDNSNHSREEIREVLRTFSQKYGGPIPQGLWADAFSIICWPITHALLPTDLQQRVARALYDAGPGLASRMNDVSELGSYVARYLEWGGDRVRQLREQPLLLGQVSQALLRPDSAMDQSILPATLARIREDVSRKREAAIWLNVARRNAEQPVIKPKFPVSSPRPAELTLEGTVERVARLSTPELVLRRSQKHGSALFLRLPSLGQIAEISPQISDALQRSTVRAPAADAPIARGRLLFDQQEVPLARWPNSHDPLLVFDGLARGLESALMRAWNSPELPAVFRLAADGTGTLIRSRAVHAGRTYALATDRELGGLKALAVDKSFDGAALLNLQIPDSVRPELARDLRRLGVFVTSASPIWIAGGIPVASDGEAAIDVISGDEITLAIKPDHDVSRIEVKFGGASIAILNLLAGTTKFVAMPDLGVGEHGLHVVEHSPDHGLVTNSSVIRVREARGLWRGGPIRAWVEPFSRSLDDVWEGRAAVCLTGMRSTATARFRLRRRRDMEPLAQCEFVVPVPMNATDWRRLFESNVASDDAFGDALDRAGFGDVEITAGALGTQHFEFERSIPPLRWRLSFANKQWMASLEDDTEALGEVLVRHYPFATPDRSNVSLVQGEITIATTNDGGLYAATRGANEAVIIVPPVRMTFASFTELEYVGTVQAVERSAKDLREALRCTNQWATSPTPGNLLARRWAHSATRLLWDAVSSALRSRAMASPEAAYLRRPSAIALIQMASKLPAIGGSLQPTIAKFAGRSSRLAMLSPKERASLLEPVLRMGPQRVPALWTRIVARRGESACMWASEFCLRLATDMAVSAWAGSDLDLGLELVLSWPATYDAARLVALSVYLGEEDVSMRQGIEVAWA